MSESTVSKKIKQLPPEAQKRANDFVDELYQRYVKEEKSEKPDNVKVSESSFFGSGKIEERWKTVLNGFEKFVNPNGLTHSNG